MNTSEISPPNVLERAPCLRASRHFELAALVCLVCASGTAAGTDSVQVPIQQTITVDDIAAIRAIDTLSLSPDGQRFAIFVRHADAEANDYRTAWLTGSIEGSDLTTIGDGGRVGPKVMPTGTIPGVLDLREARWSPDGQWIAYLLSRDGEVQLWRSHVDGSVQEQLTRVPADVQAFAWSEDGSALYFSVGRTRAERQAEAEARARHGYGYDDDLSSIFDLLQPRLPSPPKRDELSVWRMSVEDRSVRAATETEREAFRRDGRGVISEAALPPTVRLQGGWAWLVRTHPFSERMRVRASFSTGGQAPIECTAAACSGAIKQVWWSEDGRRVLIWRGEGINETEQAFYSWDPAANRATEILRLPDDELRLCALGAHDRLVCSRATAGRPDHLITIDLHTCRLKIIAEVNPAFRSHRVGRVERFEWDTPTFDWNAPGGALEGLYPKRAYGYIMYPPDFDPSRKYPVFIDPYVAQGFSPLGAEHALHAYTAHGFVVLRLALPKPIDRLARGESGGLKQLYSKTLGYPHLTLLMESTLRGLDTVGAREFIDLERVGIGGVSHGSFVPLYLMRKHDRIAAISISSPSWDPLQYYAGTRKAREALTSFGALAHDNWAPRPEGDGLEFWRDIAIADHIDEIETPILMQLSAHETYALQRLLRHLSDAGKPYDAFVYPEETHIKWQPSHLRVIMQRNLDWFRFWLQGYEDHDPGKRTQYEKWRRLREEHQTALAVSDAVRVRRTSIHCSIQRCIQISADR